MDGTQQQCSLVRCSFCDKNQEQVERFIGGRHGVVICDQCVALCHESIEEERKHQGMCACPPEQTATKQKSSAQHCSEPVPGRCPECRTRLIFAESTNPVTLNVSGTVQLIQRSGLWAVVCPQCDFAAFFARNPRKRAPEGDRPGLTQGAALEPLSPSIIGVR